MIRSLTTSQTYFLPLHRFSNCTPATLAFLPFLEHTAGFAPASPAAQNTFPQLLTRLAPSRHSVSPQMSPPQRGLSWPTYLKEHTHPLSRLTLSLYPILFLHSTDLLDSICMCAYTHTHTDSHYQGRDFVCLVHRSSTGAQQVLKEYLLNSE